ncbi:interphotoreceptor matrix proteoglycan 2 [Echeneis naucrates]|uniref:interphotoreceptor matrix proteoglycan 2 n=1 Tax=Echeneis naucrates TaxID=173247 RepID=UPI001114041C|nr:interphotoreceptor matrix proteoglycan 2 [Echeneis naucrates]
MGYLGLPNTQESAVFPRVLRVSSVKASHNGHAVISRQKRNILFPSGVKLCAQETTEQVVANHLSYFHLRVCQETIWEAFKIFWDRLPEQEEYQSWMSQCQEGTVSAQDIGSYFSQSEEHQALVKKLDNDIAVQPLTPAVLEQVVELSILLTGEMYSDDLGDPTSLQFQTLSRQLAEKIEEALEGLPGFKSVTVLDFRLDGVVVDYAVTVAVDGAGVSTEQLDYLTLQSNRVENSYREVKERPTVVYAITEIRNFATEALHKDELESMSKIPESVTAADGSTVSYLHNDHNSGLSSGLLKAAHTHGMSDVVVACDWPVSIADEPPEVMILEEDNEDGIPSELSESNAAATAESDIIVLEESVVASPAPILITSAPAAGSIEEEGLLLEDTVQTPAVENPPAEEPPAEHPSPELPEDITLPEPPVEIEASGLGTADLEDLLGPTAATEEEDKSLGNTLSQDGLTTDAAAVDADATSTANTEEAGDHPAEVVVSEGEIPGELEISTIATETTDEEGPPALVVPSEAVDVSSEESAPDAAEVGVGEHSVEGAAEELNPTNTPPADVEANQEDADRNGAPENSEESVFEDDSGVSSKSNGQEVREGPERPEAPALEEEVAEAPRISAGDLTEDEIFLVNKDEVVPPLTESLSPVAPTVLSSFTPTADVNPSSDGQPDIIIPLLVETSNEGLDDATVGDQDFDVVHYGYGLINHTEEGSTGFPFSVAHGTDQASIAMPVNPGRALMVFFSLRVTNMIFSEDLFNKSSPEYKALEQRFLELLVPYLQSNLSHFENLEILNFRNGSIVVNSRMKFGRPVARGVTTTVYLILEDFCNTAYQTMNLAIDKYSLDVESGEQADPCKFQACNEYAECKVNKWSGEAECVCNAGYFSVDGLPCQSICELRTDFCLNDGKCDIIPGQGAICRCRVGENWWYRGEHCEEYVSEPLVVGIAIASVAGFLLVASGVIFFLARTLRDQYDKDESEDPIRRAESLPSLERATKYNPMYESEATTGYSHYYRRYPEPPVYSSASAEASTDFSSEEIRHIYENSELTKEEIQDRIRIIELYAKDRQFADFVRQHQAVLDTRRESSSTLT